MNWNIDTIINPYMNINRNMNKKMIQSYRVLQSANIRRDGDKESYISFQSLPLLSQIQIQVFCSPNFQVQKQVRIQREIQNTETRGEKMLSAGSSTPPIIFLSNPITLPPMLSTAQTALIVQVSWCLENQICSTFLASQDALEVMYVSLWVSQSVSQSAFSYLTNATLVSDDT